MQFISFVKSLDILQKQKQEVVILKELNMS